MSRLSQIAWGGALNLLALTVWAGQPFPPAEAKDILQKIGDATRGLNYQGIYIFQRGVRFEVARVTHIADRRGGTQKTEALEGPRIELMRQGDRLACFAEGEVSARGLPVLSHRAFPMVLPDNPERLLELYQVFPLEMSRVADVACQELRLQPKDHLRNAVKICIEADSGVPLRFQMLNERNQVIEQLAFTQVEIGMPLQRDAVQPQLTTPASVCPQPDQIPLLSDWTLNVKGLPAGYKLIKSGKQLVKGRPESALHLLFSDGLSAVSVFFEPQAAETGMPPGAYRQGETALFVSVASGHRTVSMGEVPLTAVQQFGEKLILQPIK